MQKFSHNLKIEDPQKVTDLLFGIARTFTESQISIKRNYPNWHDHIDSRILVFTFLREVTNNALLSSIFIKDHLIKSDWWYENKNFILPTEELNKYIEDRIYSYRVDISTNFITLSFSHLEASLRSIVKSIKNTKCPKGTENLWKIRDYLIKEGKLSCDYIELFKIFQGIRNSIHSGGFHRMDSEELSFKELKIIFSKDRPIVFDPWETMKFILEEISSFLLELFNSEIIRNISETVHLFATIKFNRP